MPSSKAQPRHKIPYVVSPSVIAATLGMDRTHISRILRGERAAEPELKERIAQAVGMKVEELTSHIHLNEEMARQGVGRRRKTATKVDNRVRGIIMHCWRNPSGRPTYRAIAEQVEAETGVKVSRETVRQVVKASGVNRQAA